MDITGTIARLAGVERLGSRLRPSQATIEVDDFVVVDLITRYAPYRSGEVAGEERSLLSETMTRTHAGAVDVRANVRLTRADGSVRQARISAAPSDAAGAADIRVEAQANGQRLVIGPLAEDPTLVSVDATVSDRFGLRTTTRASAQNFRVANAVAWVEETVGISLPQLTQRRFELERAAHESPSQDLLASAAMLGALVETLESMGAQQAAPAASVAGAVRLSLRLAELLPREASLRALARAG